MSHQEAKLWLDQAEKDLKVCEHELNLPKEEVVLEAVCFHAQQASEKSLKAFLSLHDVQFGKTHNLEFLITLCSKVDIDFSSLDMGNLSSYAVEIRYPEKKISLTLTEAKKCYELAEALKAFVTQKINPA